MTRALILLAGAMLIAGCGGADANKAGAKASADGKVGLGRIDQGERCDAKIGREALVDLNQDEVPDVRKVYKMLDDDDEVLVCREADMNFDGVKDIFVFFADSGQIVRDEVDLDYDKRIDLISTYVKGKVAKQEIDTNSDGLVDRVRHMQDDQPIRLEGDTDGDGHVDLWEYYRDGKLVRIGKDDDGDGRADTWSRDSTAEDDAEKEPEEAESDGEDAAEETDTTDKKAPPKKNKADTKASDKKKGAKITKEDSKGAKNKKAK